MPKQNSCASVVVMGLGLTGTSVLRYLTESGQPCIAMDTRPTPRALSVLGEDHPLIEWHLGAFDASVCEQADTIYVSPGVALSEPAVVAAKKAGVAIRSELDLLQEASDVPILAVTGSNGKTSVTTWLGACLKQLGFEVAVCGNIGCPVLDTLACDVNLDFRVVELSSFQLESVAYLATHVAVCLNVSPDHLDRHGSFSAYQQAKMRIYSNANVAVINQEADAGYHYAPVHGQQSIHFNSKAQSDVCLISQDNERYLAIEGKPVVSLAGFHGNAHMESNALAVCSILHALQVESAAIERVLNVFTGLPHRYQWVGQHRGIDFINDSKATNVGAVISALSAASKQSARVILLAGGLTKGAPLESLSPAVAQSCCAVFLFGKDAALIKESLQGCEITCVECETLSDAFKRATAIAQAGDLILLSPAAASMDQFRSYEERGELFIDLVLQFQSNHAQKQ